MLCIVQEKSRVLILMAENFMRGYKKTHRQGVTADAEINKDKRDVKFFPV